MTSILKMGFAFRNALNLIGWEKRDERIGIGNEDIYFGQQVTGELIDPFSNSYASAMSVNTGQSSRRVSIFYRLRMKTAKLTP
jgi:hypothetical protein